MKTATKKIVQSETTNMLGDGTCIYMGERYKVKTSLDDVTKDINSLEKELELSFFERIILKVFG